ncbi:MULTISPECIES: hypothetical protein [Streptomyces]|uniref:hypothetical protein n=1 Tax=Streptomyces TaxID=1883 RepID=UPI0033DE639C
MNRATATQWTLVKRPAQVQGRRTAIAAMVGWEIREEGANWRVRTVESYLKQQPTLLTTRRIQKNQFDFLATLPIQAAHLTAGTRGMVDTELHRLEGTDSLAALVSRFQLVFLETSTSRLPDVMEAFFVEARKNLPASELLVVDVTPELSARYTLARLLLTAELAPGQLRLDELSAGRALATSGIFGAQLFTAPALLTLAPYIVGVPSTRAHAAAVWLFGRPVAGLAFPTSQLVDMVRPTSDRFSGPGQRGGKNPPVVSAEQSTAFFFWWTTQVNKVLAVATDPVNFADRNTNVYSPIWHWQYLASIERLFRDVTETLADTEYHETSQLRSAYDALDTLEGMRMGTFDTLATPSRAARTLEGLRQDLPPDIAAVALPVCQRAVDALGRVRDGFAKNSTYYTPTGLAGLPGKKGPMNKTWDDATSLYLRRDRNSAHSFLNLDEWEKTLLFAHEGLLPRGIAGLAFLYLLDLVAHLERITAKLP